MKYHPDRNSDNPSAAIEMAKINEAYEILSDHNKKKEYDMINQVQGADIGNLFSMFFDNINISKEASRPPMPPFFKVFNMGKRNNENLSHIEELLSKQIQQDLENMFVTGSVNTNIENVNKSKNELKKQEKILKPSSILVHVNIDIIQAYYGCSIPIQIDREVWHDLSIREKEKETIYITIPQGIDDNEIITLKEKGHSNQYGMTGDVKVQIKVENNSEFIRNGIDLILNKTISLKESLCGFNFEFKHLTGKNFKINNKMGNIVCPEFKKKLDNMGMIRDNHIGNLIICFHVKYPEIITEEKLIELSKILE